jgi:hypothetical protein
MLHLRGDDLEAGLFEARIDFANDVLGDGIVRRDPKITEKPATERGFSRYGCGNSNGSRTPVARVWLTRG